MKLLVAPLSINILQHVPSSKVPTVMDWSVIGELLLSFYDIFSCSISSTKTCGTYSTRVIKSDLPGVPALACFHICLNIPLGVLLSYLHNLSSDMASFYLVVACTPFDIFLQLGQDIFYFMAIPFYYAQPNQFLY